MTHDTNTIISAALSYTKECSIDYSPEILPQLRKALDLLISKQISYMDCKGIFFHAIGTTKPADVVNFIINISNTPLPSINDMPTNFQKWILQKKSRPWTEIEDMRLLAGIYKFGLEAWGSVASFVGNSRTKSQCAQRWSRGLDPNLSKNNWTKEEDSKLLKLVEKFGQKSWTKIAVEMPNRCDIQCRYRYKQLIKGTCDKQCKVLLPSIHTLFNNSNSNNNCHQNLNKPMPDITPVLNMKTLQKPIPIPILSNA